MCGVAGSLGRPGAVPRILRGLHHRGPDHQGVFEAGSLALGAARLRITGDQRGNMPLKSRSGRSVVALNGEIFNHEALFGTNRGSDVVGLADLLEEEGPAGLSRVRGPFALVAVDLRDQSLLLARDEVGVRPLFARVVGATVVASSEVPPLLAVGTPPLRDEGALDHLLAFQFWPPGRTLWRGVWSVPPGCWWRFRTTGSGLQWDRGSFASASPELRSNNCREALPTALREAFSLQGPASRPSAVTLSGGLDSSAVAGGLAVVGAPPAVAVTGYFPEGPGEWDERPYGRRVAEELGIPWRSVPITAAAYFAAWPKVIQRLGGPLAGPGAVSQWIVNRDLAASGVRVVFSGQGGDELFGGYERSRLAVLADAGQALVPAAGYQGLLEGGGSLSERFLFRGRHLLPFLNEDRARAVADKARQLPSDGPGLADRLEGFEWTHLLPGLLTVEDHVAAAFGMEGRVPLLDPVVVRLARGIPMATKSPLGESRELFREILHPFLPAAIRERRDKMGFPVPLDQWMDDPRNGAWWQDSPGLLLLPDMGFRPSVVSALRNRTIRGRAAWFLISLSHFLHHYAQRPITESLTESA